jgi:hypothetical protein
MIKFRYKKKDGDADLYMAVVLSLWPPAAGIRDKVMHALTLDQVSDNKLRTTAIYKSASPSFFL